MSSKDKINDEPEDQQESNISEQSQRDRDETEATNAGKGQHDRNTDREHVQQVTSEQRK